MLTKTLALLSYCSVVMWKGFTTPNNPFENHDLHIIITKHTYIHSRNTEGNSRHNMLYTHIIIIKYIMNLMGAQEELEGGMVGKKLCKYNSHLQNFPKILPYEKNILKSF